MSVTIHTKGSETTAVRPSRSSGHGSTPGPERHGWDLLGWLAIAAVLAAIAAVAFIVAGDDDDAPAEHPAMIDVKDHPRYGGATPAAGVERPVIMDAKDHPGYGGATPVAGVERPVMADAKDHPGYGGATPVDPPAEGPHHNLPVPV